MSYGVGQMGKGRSLGQFEQVVLTAVLSLREDTYGVRIHARVEELSAPKSASLGAVYVTLDRLEDKGFVRSWLSEPTRSAAGTPSAATSCRRWASARFASRPRASTACTPC